MGDPPVRGEQARAHCRPQPRLTISVPSHLRPQGRGRALDVLAEIQERNRAVRDLEQSLLELHQIFLDMSVLIEAQVSIASPKIF